MFPLPGAEPDLPTFSLDRFDFSPDPFGWDHGSNTAKLAVVILAHDFPDEDTLAERRALYTAATFHDCGRIAFTDADHGLRSANLCEQFLKEDMIFLGEVTMRERACALIAHHHDEDNKDPLMICLRDADALDACRVAPNTRIGIEYLKKRWATLKTDFCLNEDRQHTYGEFRGWRDLKKTGS